jgi:hypothetical protein
MKKKGLLGILAVLMVFALALTGCGQQGEQNAGATGSEGQNSTITDNGNANNGEATAEPEETPDVGEVDNRNPEMRDGKYVYEVDGTEILCKTNIWDYIDGDVWHRTEMFEDLGYMRDDNIEVPSRSPGFFRYVEDERFTAFVGSPMDKNSEDFLELRYLNELIISKEGEPIAVIVRCEQENFATDKADGPRTPIDIVIMTAYLLEQCQDDVSRWYINDIFPDAGTGILRIYQ